MKLKTTLLALAAFSTFPLQLATSFAQGSLTPPAGAPAPVMKSLDQIEARTPLIPGAPGVVFVHGYYTITQPGSYYLTGNLVHTNTIVYTNLITLAVDNVTLDLNGFTLFGTNGSLGGAISGTGSSYRVFNGHIQGGTVQTNGAFTKAGFYFGVELLNSDSSKGSDVIISDIVVRGVKTRGIVSIDSLVKSCIVDTTGKEGIFAGNVQNCRAINTSSNAITADTVINSVGKCLGAGAGITGPSDELAFNQFSVIENSQGVSKYGVGISGFSVINSYGASTYDIGVSANSANNCRGDSTSGTGLSAKVANNCIGNRPNGRAIQAFIANACTTITGTNLITHKYNMP